MRSEIIENIFKTSAISIDKIDRLTIIEKKFSFNSRLNFLGSDIEFSKSTNSSLEVFVTFFDAESSYCYVKTSESLSVKSSLFSSSVRPTLSDEAFGQIGSV